MCVSVNVCECVNVCVLSVSDRTQMSMSKSMSVCVFADLSLFFSL